ncbi:MULTISPECIES: hypothetical protein [Alphaproteobacteria]|uniref:Hemerythrin-like domain-containing protein n=2 Tax=Alphaproteobacteria TaxID=28211 RepID=A0A512HFM8_9HYPH|nr:MULTISPECIES: hypothetical protein [Alphaproteobacteria]GEO84264.1 hypothetical protein RNA01_11960 [Ciceribacter naphthalenivorans]GLR24800.1 hypothetical protein GCM10007920_45940 [Ciceribacter naphthalenivorans]GLT07656.1 hypothetical protein GCM10007926_45940 [Sphingomonas psychrolutea]
MTHHLSLTDIADLNGRFDLYGGVHKGLRKAGCDMLCRLGSTDYENPEEAASALSALRTFLMLAAAHVAHEDDNIHGVLQQRGGTTDTVDHQHDDHRRAFDQIEALACSVETVSPIGRRAAGRKLYLAFAAYLAEDLAHMHEEETETAAQLWKTFTDEELLAIEMRIVASMSPEKNMAFMRLMIPAMNPVERAAVLGSVRTGAPPEVFNAIIEFAVRPSLSEKAFSDLAARLKLAA